MLGWGTKKNHHSEGLISSVYYLTESNLFLIFAESQFVVLFQKPCWRMQLSGIFDAGRKFIFHRRSAKKVSTVPRDLCGWVLFFAQLILFPCRLGLAAVQSNPQM